MEGAHQRKGDRLVRKRELEKQREEILLERARLLSLKNENSERQAKPSSETSRNSSASAASTSRLSAAIERTKNRIPEFERKVETLRQENQARTDLLRKPYDGEMGIGSYEPWQLEDFYFVREFVRSWIDEVLDFIVRERPRNIPEYELTTVAERLFEELEVEKRHDKIFQLSFDIEQSILADVIHQAAKETAIEIMAFESQTRNMLDGILLRSFDPQSRTDAERTLINNALSEMKNEAQRKRDVWSHSQTFHLDDSEQGTDMSVNEEDDNFDGTVLHFHDITPFNALPDESLLSEQVDFQNKESEFWMGNVVDLSTLPLPRRYKGISCSAVSPNNSLIALGTVQGDVLTWDLATHPPRILRTSRGKNAAVSQLHWSLDSSLVVSLNEYGVVTVWSLGNTVSVPYDVKSFEPIEQNIGFKSSVLIPLFTLEPSDFVFTSGPFSNSKDFAHEATAVAFHPSSSLLGKQAFLMVGLNNGNILRVKFTDVASVMSFPQVHPANGTTHKIGENIDAELFKAHHHGITLISFVNNISPMVTADEKGFIYLWEYSSEFLSGFGWFVPSMKFRLKLSEMTYRPVVGAQEKVEFTDVVKGPSRKQHRLR